MTQTISKTTTFYADTKTQATFGATGPQPQFLVDEAGLKVILAGLNPGQEIPVHPEALAIYHFLEGAGVMTVNEERHPVGPGATVITPAGAKRGIKAETRLVFLAAKAQ